MWKGRRNFELNGATVLRDLYRLASMVLGDGALMTTAKDTGDPLRALRNQFLEDGLAHLLVGTAVANRIQLEHMSGPRDDPQEHSFEPLQRSCGTLRPDTEEDSVVPLSLRDACDKVIHALNIDAETLGVPEESPIPSDVTLRGTKRNKSWVARLDLNEYVRASVKNFDRSL